MIERINLIEKEAFQFSYTRIVQLVCTVLGFCGLLYGYQFTKTTLLETKIRSYAQEKEQLLQQQKVLIKAKPTQITQGSNTEIQKVFLDTPKWSDLLNDLASRLPNTVWFNSVKASTVRAALPKSGGAAPQPSKGAQPSADNTGKSILSMTGVAGNIAELTAFVAALQESPFVSKATLTNSKEENARFLFEIVCDMVVPRPE